MHGLKMVPEGIKFAFFWNEWLATSVKTWKIYAGESQFYN